MAYVKKADRLAAEQAALTPPQTDLASPVRDAAENSEVGQLKGLIQGLQAQLNAIKNAPRAGATVRNRVKTHTATLREYTKDDKVLGIVTKLYNVRELRDKSEHKRIYSTCTLEVLNPLTKEVFTATDVDYLDFLDRAPRVLAKIAQWKKDVRFETDPRRGGGGVGAVYKQGPNNELLVTEEFEYEVGYTDHTFTLEIMDGEYEGVTIETGEKALNI